LFFVLLSTSQHGIGLKTLKDNAQRFTRSAGDFAPLVDVSKHTLYSWKKKFDEKGPAGLMDTPKGQPAGSRLPEVTRRIILIRKDVNSSQFKPNPRLLKFPEGDFLRSFKPIHALATRILLRL